MSSVRWQFARQAVNMKHRPSQRPSRTSSCASCVCASIFWLLNWFHAHAFYMKLSACLSDFLPHRRRVTAPPPKHRRSL